MAHKKGGGSSRNGRDSESNRLGVKKFGGELVVPGNIIVRQRGTAHNPGENVYAGKDHTLHAKIDGIVKFEKKKNNKASSFYESSALTWSQSLPSTQNERNIETNVIEN